MRAEKTFLRREYTHPAPEYGTCARYARCIQHPIPINFLLFQEGQIRGISLQDSIRGYKVHPDQRYI